jgi:L-lactate dehydrogenase (cytochrome)
MRELRNGFQVPFKMGLSQILDLSSHPLWSLKTLLAGIPKPVLINESEDRFDRKALRIGATWEFLDKLRVMWKGKIIVKGILSVDDAKRARSAGMDAIWVSNHGGRQLDAAPAAIEVLPIIRDALGDEFPIAFDSGIRDGSDVVKALAKGANFTFLGRPILHSLAAAGGPGLEKILSIFYEDINVVMAQIGINQIDEINSSVLSGGQG